jgi:uncharacterized protein
VHSSGKLFE